MRETGRGLVLKGNSFTIKARFYTLQIKVKTQTHLSGFIWRVSAEQSAFGWGSYRRPVQHVLLGLFALLEVLLTFNTEQVSTHFSEKHYDTTVTDTTDQLLHPF